MKTQYFWDMFVSNAGGQGGHTSNRGLMATNEAGSSNASPNREPEI